MILTLLGRFWPYIAIAVLTLAVYVQTVRLNAVKAEYAAFKVSVKAVGEAQEAKAKAQMVVDKQNKEKSDAENVRTKRDLAGLYDAYGRLRDQADSRSRFVPPAPAGSASPLTASFDRTALNSAISDFDKGVTGFLRKGDEAIVDLNTAKSWAQK